MLTVAFGLSTMSRIQVQLWYNRYKEGLEDINDDARSGHPSTSITDVNFEAVKEIILNNCRITIEEVADDAGISFGSYQAIFTDVLGIKRTAVKMIPKLLNFKQKQLRVDIDPDLNKKVIIGDEL